MNDKQIIMNKEATNELINILLGTLTKYINDDIDFDDIELPF
jgi:hypothetical protein